MRDTGDFKEIELSDIEISDIELSNMILTEDSLEIFSPYSSSSISDEPPYTPILSATAPPNTPVEPLSLTPSPHESFVQRLSRESRDSLNMSFGE